MPRLRKGETKKSFVEGAIPILLKEKTAKTPAQAVAIANSMYKKKKK